MLLRLKRHIARWLLTAHSAVGLRVSRTVPLNTHLRRSFCLLLSLAAAIWRDLVRLFNITLTAAAIRRSSKVRYSR